MNRRQWFGLSVIALCAVSVGILNKQDAEGIELAQQRYCEMVGGGYWPDYNGNYKSECGGKDPPHFHEDLTK